MLNKHLFTEKEEKDASRAGFGRGLLNTARKNKNVYALTADLGGSTKVMDFASEFPDRFVQVGVAEQNLVTVSSGLAHIGKIPYATSFAAFSPGRCLEQIRTTICYNDRKVNIVGSHTGLGVGEDGATHQALEDIAIMRSLPNMIVIQPCDALQAEKAAEAIASEKKPCYLRIHRHKSPILTDKNTSFKIGEGQVFKKGEHITLIATGPVVYEALKAANELEEEGISVEVLNYHTIKPIDENLLLKSTFKTDMVVTVEDHQVNGGLGSAISEVLSEKNPIPVKRLGMNDSFGESGDYNELYEKYGFTSNSLKKEIKKFVEEN